MARGWMQSSSSPRRRWWWNAGRRIGRARSNTAHTDKVRQAASLSPRRKLIKGFKKTTPSHCGKGGGMRVWGELRLLQHQGLAHQFEDRAGVEYQALQPFAHIFTIDGILLYYKIQQEI